MDEVVALLQALTPQPGMIQVKGYIHATSPTAHVPLDQVITAFWLITKYETRPPREELAMGDCTGATAVSRPTKR